jgi:hypothetical protein
MAFSFDRRIVTASQQAAIDRREARKAAIDLLNAGISDEQVIAQVPGITVEIIGEIFADGCVLRRPTAEQLAKPFRCSDADLH